VDRTLYTSLNGMFIASFLKAYRVLGDSGLRDFALTSLNRILKERFIGGELFHTDDVPAVLEDHIYLIEALIAAYEATGDPAQLDAATDFMDRCLERFGDSEGGFFDTEEEVLGTRLKRVEDIPHPSANATAALLLIKLFHLTGREPYRSHTEKVLRIFSVTVKEMSIHAGMYYCALDAWFTMLKLTVEAAPASDLAFAARRLTGPYTVVVYSEDKKRIVPCIGETCHAPVTSKEELVRIASQLTSS
jgi:uncharacterized protein YyaL (SSP411 family)